MEPRQPKLFRAFLIGLLLVDLAALFAYFFIASPGTERLSRALEQQTELLRGAATGR